jgi:hypothetical protein
VEETNNSSARELESTSSLTGDANIAYFDAIANGKKGNS